MSQFPTHSTEQANAFESVRKRDGRMVPFEANKIKSAILRAGKATGEFSEEKASHLAIKVLQLLQTIEWTDMPSVEEIQDVVETVLLNSPFKRTAKAYILYRDQHARVRKMAEKSDVDLIEQYLDKLDWNVKENSNMSYSLQGLNNYVAGQITENYWLNQIYTPKVREAHESGKLHIHDLGILSVYCVGWDLQDLLMLGFRGASNKIESNPPRHFRSALGQIVNFFYTLQGEAAGAQALANFDTLLAPFVRRDSLSYSEVKQALQEFIFNLNIPTRVGFQTPFTNITMDVKVPGVLADEHVVIDGEIQDEQYRDFQKEVDLINRAFIDVLLEGDARGRPFTFPIPTYNITPEFDWESEVLEDLWKLTARYGTPYFTNFINSDMSPDDVRSMCCRLRLDTSELEKRGGGLFGANPLTGSIGVVTLNLPRLAYKSRRQQEFFEGLDRLMEVARTSLETKRSALESFTDAGLYPYSQFYLRAIKQKTGKYWTNHFSTIGIVGANEACLNLFGEDISTAEGQKFSRRLLKHMRQKLDEFNEETGNIYNLEATPAESTAYRLARKDDERFEQIQFAPGSSTDIPFYTNSTQLPVNHTTDVFCALNLQEELQSMYTGGTVMHVYLGEAAPDEHAVKNFLRRTFENYELPYLTITPTFSVCPTHGYIGGEHNTCPRCDRQTEVYSRVVGYLRPVSQWNEGKQQEWNSRKHFKKETMVSDL